jgi:hypothetical protein
MLLDGRADLSACNCSIYTRTHAPAGRARVRHPLPLALTQEGSSGPGVCCPRVFVSDVDGEEFEEAKCGPVPCTRQSGTESVVLRKALPAVRAPLPEHSYSVPRTEDRDAETGEILHVARNQGQAVFKCGRRNHAIRRTKGPARQLSHPIKPTPSRRNCLRYGQNALRKQKCQMAFERCLQTRPPRGVLHGCKSRFQFADAHDA